MEKLDCGHAPSEHSEHTTGYGLNADGRKHCYDCCAENEYTAMKTTGRATLYDCESEVTDWPGKLRFRVNSRSRGKHNMAGQRFDLWFTDRDGLRWHGVRYGDNTQLVHCKRMK